MLVLCSNKLTQRWMYVFLSLQLFSELRDSCVAACTQNDFYYGYSPHRSKTNNPMLFPGFYFLLYQTQESKLFDQNKLLLFILLHIFYLPYSYLLKKKEHFPPKNFSFILKISILNLDHIDKCVFLYCVHF